MAREGSNEGACGRRGGSTRGGTANFETGRDEATREGRGWVDATVARDVYRETDDETFDRAQYTAASFWFTIWLDIIWLASYATHVIDSKQGWTSGALRGNEFSVGMICMIFILRFPQFFVWQKLWHLGFKTTAGSGQQARYVDFHTNAAARGTEMSAPPATPGSAFAQPPRAMTTTVPSASSPPSPPPPPPPRAAVPPAPAPAALEPPAPLSPAVVPFTPSGVAGDNNAMYAD